MSDPDQKPIKKTELQEQINDAKETFEATHAIISVIAHRLKLSADDVMDAAGLDEFEAERVCQKIRKILRN